MKLFIGFIGRTRGGKIVTINGYDGCCYYSDKFTSHFHNGLAFEDRNDDIIEQINQEPDRTQKVDVLIESAKQASFWMANAISNEGFISPLLKEKYVKSLEDMENAINSYEGNDNE